MSKKYTEAISALKGCVRQILLTPKNYFRLFLRYISLPLSNVEYGDFPSLHLFFTETYLFLPAIITVLAIIKPTQQTREKVLKVKCPQSSKQP